MFTVSYIDASGMRWYYSVERGAFATEYNPDGFTKFGYFVDANAVLLSVVERMHKGGVPVDETNYLHVSYIGAY